MKWHIGMVMAAVLAMPMIDKSWRYYLASACLRCEKPPAESADLQLLIKRLESLEARVAALEAPKPEPPKEQVTKTKPVLYVHSETWCGPCQTFKADVAAAGELPVEIVYQRFSSYVPAFRWTDAAGKTITRTGYAKGSLDSLLKEVAGK
jgi:hypothetical protein